MHFNTRRKEAKLSSKLRIKPEVTIQSFEEEDALKIVQQLDILSEIFGPTQPILVHVDSYGGSIDGLALIYEKLQSMQNTIITYCSSKAMSAGATILIAAASKGNRVCTPNCSIMIHELSAGNYGKLREMENVHNYLLRENHKWSTIIAHAMGLKSAEELRELLDTYSKRTGDMYIDAKTALKMNVVDRIGYLDMKPVTHYETRYNPISRKDMELKTEQLQAQAAKKKAPTKR